MNLDISLTLAHLRPSEEWTLDGDGYEGLTWLSKTPKPTEAEIVAAWPAAQAAAEAKAEAAAEATSAAIAHAKSLGFSDAMIAVMYPNLGAQNE